jgi:hypothetical protein
MGNSILAQIQEQLGNQQY